MRQHLVRRSVRGFSILAIAVLVGPILAVPARAASQATLSISDVTVSQEGCQSSPMAVFTVTLSPPYGRIVTVQYASADGTARAGIDYTAVAGTLMFARGGKRAQTIVVPVGDVLVPGPGKSFHVDLSAPVGAVIGDGRGVATIQAPAMAKCRTCGLSCDDGDPCTVDSCSATLGCRHVNGSAATIPYCALAGLGNAQQPDPNFGACNAGGFWADSDGDGLSDAAETQGYIDVDANGLYDEGVDVALPGADPHVVDVYLHYDYAVAADHDHNPPPLAIQYMADAFAAHGARLHIDPHHNAIDESTVKVVTAIQDPPDPSCAGPNAASLNQLRAALLPPHLGLAYHYMVFSHWSSCDNPTDCGHCPIDPECGGGQPPQFGSLGNAEVGGRDAIVSLGPFVDTGTPLSLQTWAGLAMHELGHNLGLLHGGGDCDNFKPNYVSVMNYAFYSTGISVGASPGDTVPKACLTDADCAPPAHCSDPEASIPNACFRIDYSGARLSDLNEFSPAPGVGGLDESQGLSGSPLSTDISYYSLDGYTAIYMPTNGAPIDWNRDGAIGNHVSQDLNLDGALTTLQGFDDWAVDPSGRYSHLSFDFQCVNAVIDRPR